MFVQSIQRAFALLRALAKGPVGVTELAERVDLPKSTVARILAALETEGAVTQAGIGGEYRLGDGLLDIAGATQPGSNLVATARPYLIDLCNEVGEAAGVSIINGRSVYYLDHVEVESDVQVRSWTGELAPLHAVAAGLVMLAHFTEPQLDAYLQGPLAQLTPWTVVDPAEICSRLSTVASLGYAWVYEEFAEGINSVAAPIVENDGNVVAALHIHGPAYRFPNPERTHDLGNLIINAANSLAENLTTDSLSP